MYTNCTVNLFGEPNLQVSRSFIQPIHNLESHLSSSLETCCDICKTVSRPCISLGGLNCQKSSYNKMFEFQFNEEPQCIRIETVRMWCGTIATRILIYMVVYTWFRHIRSGVVIYIQRIRDHGQILPTLRHLHPQNSESKIVQSIFLAGEITSIQKKLIQLNVIPNVMFPLILGLREA